MIYLRNGLWTAVYAISGIWLVFEIGQHGSLVGNEIVLVSYSGAAAAVMFNAIAFAILVMLNRESFMMNILLTPVLLCLGMAAYIVATPDEALDFLLGVLPAIALAGFLVLAVVDAFREDDEKTPPAPRAFKQIERRWIEQDANPGYFWLTLGMTGFVWLMSIVGFSVDSATFKAMAILLLPMALMMTIVMGFYLYVHRRAIALLALPDDQLTERLAEINAKRLARYEERYGVVVDGSN